MEAPLHHSEVIVLLYSTISRKYTRESQMTISESFGSSHCSADTSLRCQSYSTPSRPEGGGVKASAKLLDGAVGSIAGK